MMVVVGTIVGSSSRRRKSQRDGVAVSPREEHHDTTGP